MNPETWFWYVFGTVFGLGLGIVAVIFFASVFGIEINFYGEKK